MIKMKKAIVPILAGAVGLVSSNAFGDIFFSLTGPTSPVTAGSTFSVTLSAYTNNPEGVHDITAKLDQQVGGATVTSANYQAYLNPAVAIPASSTSQINTQITFGPATTADPDYTNLGIKGRYIQATGLPNPADINKLSSPAPAFNSFGIAGTGAEGAYFSASNTPILLTTYTFKTLPTATGSFTFKVGATSDGATYQEWTDYDNGVFAQPTNVNLGSAITVNIASVAPSATYAYAYDAATAASGLGGTTAGTLHVLGGGGNYYNSPVLTGLTSTKGYLNIGNATLGEGTQLPVFVLVSFAGLGGTNVTLDALRTNMLASAVAGSQTAQIFDANNDTGDTNGQLALLLAQYGASGFTATNSLLYELTSATTAIPNFGWDLTGSGLTVSGVVAVPEPASMGLLALGAIGLLGRRRK